MTDSEMRAIVQASFMMLQKLIVEVAATKGDEGSAWIDAFRDDLTSEMKKVEELQKHRAATERAVTSRMLIEGVPFLRGPGEAIRKAAPRPGELVNPVCLADRRRTSLLKLALRHQRHRYESCRRSLDPGRCLSRCCPGGSGMASLKLL